jgi:hypothetical protein
VDIHYVGVYRRLLHGCRDVVDKIRR